jgi:hypothetical protein
MIAVDAVVLWGFWAIFTTITYLALRFVRFVRTNPPSPRCLSASEETFDSLSNEPSGGEKEDEERDTNKRGHIEWIDLGYSVRTKFLPSLRGGAGRLQLLAGISGYCKPGMLLALMVSTCKAAFALGGGRERHSHSLNRLII